MATVENIIEKTAQEMYDRAMQMIEEQTGVSLKRLCELAAGDANGEIAPVVHGKWVLKREEGGWVNTVCSVCGRFCCEDDAPYCYCGAKMDL